MSIDIVITQGCIGWIGQCDDDRFIFLCEVVINNAGDCYGARVLTSIYY